VNERNSPAGETCSPWRNKRFASQFSGYTIPMKTQHENKTSWRTVIIKKLTCFYLRRKLKRHWVKIAACILAVGALFSLCLVVRHKMQ